MEVTCLNGYLATEIGNQEVEACEQLRYLLITPTSSPLVTHPVSMACAANEGMRARPVCDHFSCCAAAIRNVRVAQAIRGHQAQRLQGRPPGNAGRVLPSGDSIVTRGEERARPALHGGPTSGKSKNRVPMGAAALGGEYGEESCRRGKKTLRAADGGGQHWVERGGGTAHWRGGETSHCPGCDIACIPGDQSRKASVVSRVMLGGVWCSALLLQSKLIPITR